MSDDGCLLIVRHGPDRGRGGAYLAPVLDYFAERAPELSARLRLHATGSGAEPDLGGVHAVLFWLGDPLRELYPDCFAEASRIEDAARERGVRIVNPPAALSNSAKTRQASLWGAAGLLTPAHERFTSRAELLALADRHAYPLLVKSDQAHEQIGMHVCRSRSEVEDLDAPLPGAVAEFVDTRAGYADTRPDTPWARYFHKKRIAVFGDVLHPRHLFFSEDPIVGLRRCVFQRYAALSRDGARWRTKGHLLLHPEHRACIREDRAYAAAPPDDADTIRRAAAALGLEFVAIDYSTLADGRTVLWEANPYFWLPGPGSYLLPEQRGFEERFHGFYSALRGFFESLLAAD